MYEYSEPGVLQPDADELTEEGEDGLLLKGLPTEDWSGKMLILGTMERLEMWMLVSDMVKYA